MSSVLRWSCCDTLALNVRSADFKRRQGKGYALQVGATPKCRDNSSANADSTESAKFFEAHLAEEYRGQKESRWTENNLIKTLPPTSVPSDLGSNFVHLNTVMRTPLGESIPMSLHYRLRCKRHFYGQGCGVFCHGQRGTHGNYECDPNTGHIVCLDGWRGDRCTEDLNFCSRHPGICQNGGQCVNNQRHTDGFHHCHCRQGYKGKHCELREVDCRTQGCNGAGRCVKQQDYKHACQCSPGHFGDLCESTQPIAEPILSANGSEFSGSEKDVMQKCTNNTCLNGGLCSELPRSFSCKCPQGFGGHKCESNLCGCGKSQDCLAKCMNTTQHPETMSDYWNLDPDIKHITVHQHSSGWGDILTFVIVAALLGSSLVVLLCFTLCWFRNRKRDLPFGLASNCGYCAIQNEPFQTFNNQLENDVSCHVSVAKLSQPQTTELDTPGFLPTSKATDHRPCETDSGHHKSKLTSTWIDAQQLFTDIHSNPTKVVKQHMGAMR
ncbi:hypothetical protein T265_11336 [Opisthorchis viverrini]|uniref:Delta-like protein n=1 Tax=Opisthorchis viverrini TaxID=6198 RepID=A0A074YYZ6_OPIVI|nr:hypothetical protein T265_11336 [Opisthorchis viverrini]KER20016.1 hypothetical protein T265_11336 [Opisthorchis viverrini]